MTVRIWQNATAYYDELTRYFGTRYQATGYITGPTELRLLAGGNLNTSVVRGRMPKVIAKCVPPTGGYGGGFVTL